MNSLKQIISMLRNKRQSSLTSESNESIESKSMNYEEKANTKIYKRKSTATSRPSDKKSESISPSLRLDDTYDALAFALGPYR